MGLSSAIYRHFFHLAPTNPA
ncbi:hypothetical protein S40285_10928 [Stachybotrys chlorohalonatus IBT 40285]|uniref:Uncharacterized protein n=1 Tax=Stachybotrys chlorohalonatus (strain IBT 40285) TaxID=1283841 RepID=A0A084QUH0_STAC4|nr:hypothetical protein S40285_10928 [Stachybotrys chlorohalonata IBT 40285]